MDHCIIDGNNFTMIAWFAVRDNLDPVYSLRRTLSSMCDTIVRDFFGKVYVCFDTYGGTHWRKELYPRYKSNRPNDPEAFRSVSDTKDIYRDCGIEVIEVPNCEGDDAIYALCRTLREQPDCGTITIVSRDHDLLQIIQKGAADHQYDYTKDRFLSVPDYDIVVWKSLVGDSSDNIGGVSRIGEKTAPKVISGELKLSESQHAEYEMARRIVDLDLNPNIGIIRDCVKTLIIGRSSNGQT